MKAIFSKPQQQAFATLLNQAHFYFRENKREESHPISIRSNILLRAPSGVGKTHIVSEIAKNLDIPLKRINVSTWAVQGSRYGKATFGDLYEFVKNNRRGIIFVDEIDKIPSSGSEWLNSLRLELHELLDYKIPQCIEISAAYPQPGDDNEFPVEHDGLEYKKYSATEMREYYEGRLKHDFLIVGAGAWHEATHTGLPIGFNHEDSVSRVHNLSYGELESMISPEILRRFNSSHIVMPPMGADDYEDLILRVARSLPSSMQESFKDRALATVSVAVERALEFRLIEDVLQSICLKQFQDKLNTTSDPTLLK